jgi:hypothetical protein
MNDRRVTQRLRHAYHRAPLAAGAIVRALLTEALLRTTRLPVTARVMGAPLAAPEDDVASSDGPLELSARERRQLRATHEVLRRSPFGSTCLRRALCAGHVLRARRPRLVVGVAKHDGVVSAHAWLVVAGINLDPDGSSDFHPLPMQKDA